MEAIKAKFGSSLFGPAIRIFLPLVVMLSLPLTVIALMRLNGWGWWSAFSAACVLFVIPIIGQIGYLVLAIMGAYYFFQADFNWREAVAPTPVQIAQNTYLTGQERSAFVAGGVNACMRDDQLPFSVSTPALEEFCRCYWNGLADRTTIAQLKGDDADLVPIRKTVTFSCAVRQRPAVQLNHRDLPSGAANERGQPPP
jgi:hypothetical protein